MAVQMGLTAFAQQSMGGMGIMPMGVNSQNVADRFIAQRFSQQHDEVIRRAAVRDRASVMRTMGGIAAATGAKWDQPQQQAMQGVVDKLPPLMPALMQLASPMALDVFGGERGLESVMAHYMVRGGRYRIDPVTGRSGMSPQAMEQMVGGAYDEAIKGDNFYKGAGMSAGQMGQMFMEFQKRGMIRGGVTSPTQLQEIAEFRPGAFEKARTDMGIMGKLSELDAGQRDALVSHPEVSTAIRAFDGKRAAKSLGEWADSIQAMKEIFGEAGHPNAPMPMLINAMNALTAGGMSQLDPGQINTMVRSTVNLATRSGIGLQGASVLTQQAAENLRQLGVSETFAPLVAQQGMAFHAAFQGLGMGAYQARGRGDINQIRQIHEQMTAGAIGSKMANQAGLAMRLNKLGAFKEGTAAANFVQALAGGKKQFQWGEDMVGTDIREEEFTRMLTESAPGRFTSGEIPYMMMQEEANRGALQDQPGVTVAILRQQRETAKAEAIGAMWDAPVTKMAGVFGVKSLNRVQKNLAPKLSAAVAETLFTASEDLLTGDDDKLDIALGKSLRAQLEATVAAKGPDAADAQRLLDAADQSPTMLAQIATSMRADVDRRNAQLGRPTLQNVLAATDPETLNQAIREKAIAEAHGIVQTASGAVGKGSVLRRVMEQVMSTEQGDEDALKKIFAAGMGGVRGDDIAAGLSKFVSEDGKVKGLTGIRGLELERDRLAEAYADSMVTGDAAQQEKALKAVRANAATIGGMRGQIRTHMAGLGIEGWDTAADAGDKARIDRITKVGTDITAYYDPNSELTDEERRRMEDTYEGLVDPVGAPANAARTAIHANLAKAMQEPPADQKETSPDQDGKTVTFRVLKLVIDEGGGASGSGDTIPEGPDSP